MLDRSMVDAKPHPEAGPAMPVSESIRARLVESGQRFHANDNISAVLREGELEALRTVIGPTIISSFRCDTLGKVVSSGAGR